MRNISSKRLYLLKVLNNYGIMSDPVHKLQHLLPSCLEGSHDHNTRSNSNQFYNYKFKTERFRNSPIVYAILKYN